MAPTGQTVSWIESFSRSARIVFALAIVAFCGGITEYVVSLNRDQTVNAERSAAVEQLATVRARIEGEIFSTLHLSRGLISYVATHPNLTWDEFEVLAAELTTVGRHIRNIGLAPDNVIQFMYPITGNERAIGLDYTKNKDQWPAVKRAIDLGNTVVAGPLDLVQGGRGLIARTPIYIQNRNPQPGTPPQYWGLASIVIDFPALFQSAGVKQRMGALTIAIRGKDGRGQDGDMVFGEKALFDHPNVVLQTIMLPNGTWQLGAVPTAGWGQNRRDMALVRLIGWSIALGFGVLVYGLLALEHRNRALALRDPLTTLPNRRLMYDRLEQLVALNDRSELGFTVLYLDLNGFKPINDAYGHAVGDKILIEVSERLLALTRRSDTVARVGGDEFVIILPGVTDAATVDNVIAKLHDGLGRPIKLGAVEVDVSAAIGFASFPEHADDIDRLINIADKMMYQKKAAKVMPLHVVAPD